MTRSEPVVNLGDAIAQMTPVLTGDDYVFCTLANGGLAEAAALQGVIAAVSETEGWTVVLPVKNAEQAGLDCDNTRFACITLQVQTSLLAVGLTAIVASELGEAGIACNAIAGANHDHLFVPSTHAAQAMAVLRDLSG